MTRKEEFTITNSKKNKVIQYYNQLTYIDNEFDLLNYIHSFKYSRYGLLLSYALIRLNDNGINFTILSGFNKEDDNKNEFKNILIDILDETLKNEEEILSILNEDKIDRDETLFQGKKIYLLLS